MITSFRRVMVPGRLRDGDVWVRAGWDEQTGRLSLAGVVGPLTNGDAMGSSGQITGELLRLANADPERIAGGWTRARIARLAEIWDRWHLNDMRPGCAHQRALGWERRRFDENKPANHYGRHYEGQSHPTSNLCGWIYGPSSRGGRFSPGDWHERGLLLEPCPECGYLYGSVWMREEVPDEIQAELRAFPEASMPCPWSDL